MEINLECDLKLFTEETIMKVISQMRNISLKEINKTEDKIVLSLYADSASSIQNIHSEFNKRLVEQKLKDKVYDETKDIRTLILANAFSKTSLIDY